MRKNGRGGQKQKEGTLAAFHKMVPRMIEAL